jgi:outer membrane biosynthesis protein TonB
MADENNDGAQAATEETPPEGNPNPETPTTPEVPETPDTPETPETPEIPETPEDPNKPVDPELKKARGEAAKYRTERNSAVKRAETAETERDTARAELKGYKIRDAVRNAAADTARGIRDAELVLELIKTDALSFETKDGKETVKGLDTELARIKSRFPNLFFDVPGSADAGAQGGAPAGDGNDWLRSQMSGS